MSRHRAAKCGSAHRGRTGRGGPGFGYWHHEGHRKYFEKFQFVRYNPDGTVAGFQRITKHVSMSGRNNKTANLVTEALDVDGNVLESACAVETSTRWE